MEGNQQKIREALAEISKFADDWEFYGNTKAGALDRIYELANAAIATTPRNCDVGTLTEQQNRFHDFCEKMQHTDKACCGGCPIVYLRMKCVIGNSCELAWAQMPYEAEQEGENHE